jgi:hypothetical protein
MKSETTTGNQTLSSSEETLSSSDQTPERKVLRWFKTEIKKTSICGAYETQDRNTFPKITS